MPSHDDILPASLDLEILSRDIQAISSADAVAAFFARLGYNTNARLKQTPANLGMAAEGTSRPIRNVELIADHEGFLQVYLFELSSVTVTHTRALARAFKNRVGDQLLVLTSDYESLDFVLLEKYLPADESGATPMTQKQVSRRPRVLTVNRRNASPVQLRVLRRFTWTEPDSFAQYDKLVSAYSVADWSEEYFNNHALFSDYYLKERLPDEPQWREQSKPAYTTLKSLYRNAATQFAQTDFPVLVRQLFEPIFGHLGFAMVRPPKGDDPKALPHFLLQSPGGGPTLATCLAYPWNRNLDGKDEKDPERAAENPSATVVSLLERGESRWSIVTNGKLWRLYSAEAHSRATNYYEIDLQEILAEAGSAAASPGDAFPFFWLLFRRDAFVERETDWDGNRVRLSFLDLLLRQSQQYAKLLGENLKRRVFEDVFPQLAQGFITFVRSQEGAQAAFSEARLASIFQGTLTLLYRLLFLLYAESRNLLPVREIRGYFEASLTRLKQEVADRAGDIDDERWDKLRHAYREDSFDLYERLNRLFRIIDQGDPSVNVPVYNGGLFLLDPKEDDPTQEAVNARFLGEHRVPDTHLAMALDLLERDVDSKKHSLVMIDYKTLGVRHLGSIYEGLLEFKIRIADRKLAITKQDGNEIYTPFSELAERQQLRAEREGRIVKKGRVYLENDKHERKASGSYYTPDHIVKYIVENTVGPVLKAKFDALRPKLREAQVARRAFFQKQEALKKIGLRPEPDMKADLIGQDLADEFFDCKVLDPAMGSGHFLVEAVDFITDKTLDFLSAFPTNPVFAYLGRMRMTILQEMEQKGITIDEKKLTDVNLLKRHVLKRCIYGVDLNPMAVELAKVSLWLDCFTLGAPLSFLDHHLRCGNSLIGATVHEVEEALAEGSGTQFGLFETRFPGLLSAVDAMRQVGDLSDITDSQIGESRAQYRKAEGLLAPLQRWLDVYTSQWFGNGAEGKRRRGSPEREPIAVTFLRHQSVQAFLTTDDEKRLPALLRALPSELRQIADCALAAAEESKFFHWELEFPEVFYGPRPGSSRSIERLPHAGFDAVVGNPPYVGFHGFADLKSYLVTRYQTCRGKFDIYLPFWEAALALAGQDRYVGFVNPSGFMKRDHGRQLRELMVRSTIVRLHDFLHNCVFEGATNYVCVPIVQCSPATPDHEIVATVGSSLDSPPHHLSQASLNIDGWTISGDNTATTSLGALSTVALEDLADIVAEGIVTGKNEVFLVEANSDVGRAIRDEGMVKRALRGESVDRYVFFWDGTLLIYPYHDVNGKVTPLTEAELRRRAPNTYRYLLDCREKLQGRPWFANSSKAWFELWNQRSIRHQSAIKLVIQENSVRCEWNLDDGSHFYLDTCCGVTLRSDTAVSYWYLLAVLNSTFIDLLYRRTAVPKAQGHFIHKPMFLKKLPIRQIVFDTPLAERTSRVESLKQLYTSGKHDEMAAAAKSLVYGPPGPRASDSGPRQQGCSDVLHDVLEFLARELSTLVAGLKSEAEGFLKNVDGLATLHSGDTLLQATGLTAKALFREDADSMEKAADRSFKKLWAALKKNRHLCPDLGDCTRRNLFERYQESRERRIHIKKLIARVDRLTDDLVSLLYGAE